MDWKGRSVMECDGKAWNMMEGPEWCQNDVGVSGMDLEKFYVTKGENFKSKNLKQ